MHRACRIARIPSMVTSEPSLEVTGARIGTPHHSRVPASGSDTQGDPLLRLLIESVREYAIFMLDPGGHVRTWNRGAERIKGYRAEEIIGQHFGRFYSPGTPREKLDAELEHAVRHGHYEEENWRIRKDGT